VKANPIIAEVFNNYISNAIKYAKAGKKIVIEGKRKADFITIAVKDFGTSIPEIEYEHIFERNIQLRTQEKRGRGLGLAIVKRIAEAHNAEFGIIPNKPNGNIFFIKIPL
ncbi:MAG: ATP-binding protein, partial [Candidatus Marinimicrobia bacterium]|nr:ATP-binding protein [Candidatus Neomarinimicrobiota bacterium]